MREFFRLSGYRFVCCLLTSSLSFDVFFNHVDHYPANTFLYLTSAGIAASQGADPRASHEMAKAGEETLAGIESEPEEDASGAEGG